MISGEKIKRLRLSRGLSQKQIAEYCKCDRAYISEIESFKRIPSEELYEKIIKGIYTLDDRSKEVKNKKSNRKDEVILKNERGIQEDIAEVVRGTE